MSLIAIDRDASTVEIAGRIFPAAAVICPPEDGFPDRDDYDRSLGSGGGDLSVFIPAENGVLIRVEQTTVNEETGAQRLDMSIDARTCYRSDDIEGWIWLPYGVGLRNGALVAPYALHNDEWDWRGCEPTWVVWFIDWVASKPFTQPEGPPVALVRLDHFKEDACA